MQIKENNHFENKQTKVNCRLKNIIVANHNQSLVNSTDNQKKSSANSSVLVNHNQTMSS